MHESKGQRIGKAPSLPCLHTFWHAIPTSFYIFNVFLFSCIHSNEYGHRTLTRAKFKRLSFTVTNKNLQGPKNSGSLKITAQVSFSKSKVSICGSPG